MNRGLPGKEVREVDTKEPDHTVSSGYVFADLGLPNAEELQARAALVNQIAGPARARGGRLPAGAHPHRRAPPAHRTRKRVRAISLHAYQVTSGSKLAVDKVQIESLRVVVRAYPFPHLLVLRVSRPAEDLNHFSVPVHAAAVFMGEGALARHTHGVGRRLVRWDDLFQHNLVLPMVTEIVHIPETRPRHQRQSRQLVARAAQVMQLAIWIRMAVLGAGDLEHMKMVVPPAAYDLDGHVQLVQRDLV